MLTLFLLDYLGRPVIVQENVNPCVPSPCGPNSQCRVVGSHAACSCLPNYVGRAPSCRPECTINEECPSNLACQAERCRDPCAGSCGAQATCIVVKHSPVCNCQTGFTGDPFSGCSKIASKIISLPPIIKLKIWLNIKAHFMQTILYISPILLLVFSVFLYFNVNFLLFSSYCAHRRSPQPLQSLALRL
jgi:hypothetical protein